MEKTSKKKKISKKRPPHKVNVELSDGTKVEADSDNRKLVKKQIYNNFDDVEAKPAPKDNYSKLKYPPPKKNPLFRQKWARLVDIVAGRPNFKPGHLESLEILCDLYVELEDLSAFLRVNGRSFKVLTTTGDFWRMFPEVAQRDAVRSQIEKYSRNLDLFPNKAKQSKGSDSKDDEEWT